MRRRLRLESLDSRLLLAADIRFAVIGDYGTASQGEADVATLVKSWNPDFVTTTGDNNYQDGAASTIDKNIGQFYHDFIFPYFGSYGNAATTNRFFPTLGNHDWHAPNAQPYLDYFTLPGNERYYTFTQGPVEFFMVDSDPNEPDGITSTSVQGNWIHNQMDMSSATWKLVMFHHPPYSSGDHGSTSTMQWPFPQWGATAVLSGHDHDYERLSVGGLTYFVDGAGGAGLYQFGTPLPGSQVRYNADFGAMLVTASDTQINFQFIARTGTVVDTYSITSSGNNVPTVNVTATDASASEPGTDTGTFTVSRTGATTSALTVNYAVSGTATNGTDYNLLSGTITIDAGQSSAVISLVPRDDLSSEGTETATVTISPSAAYNLGSLASATVAIADNEASSTIVETRVAASADDAEEQSSGAVGLTSSDLELVRDSTDQTVGMRFNGLAIPRGATITNAYIQFQVDEATSEQTTLTLRGQAADNAAAFTTAQYNVSPRPRTTSSTAWSPASWPTVGAQGLDQRTPNIASLVQEIVNRTGWLSGNSLAIIVTGTGHRVAKSYDGDRLAAPLLHVEYLVGNRAPVANNQSVTTPNDTSLGITLTASDADGDALTYLVVTPPTHGTLAGSPPNLTYTPADGYIGADSFTFRANDGKADSNLATVSISVTRPNHAPVADDLFVTTPEDNAAAVRLSGSDADGDPLVFTVVAPPRSGTLSGTAPNLTYRPNANFFGSDSFTYRANDGIADSNSAVVSITVTSVNDAPVAVNNSYSVTAGATLSVAAPGVLANDSDVDNDPLTTQLVAGPSHGVLSLAANGGFTYTPAAGFSGADSFTYRASDGALASNVATVTLNVASAANATLSFQDGVSPDSSYRGTVDTKIKSDSPTVNFGSATTLEIDGSPNYGSLIKWDLRAIPAGSTVTAVTLTFNVVDVTGHTYGIFPLLRNWTESGATWNVTGSGPAWELPGAFGATDRGKLSGTLTSSTKGIKTITLNSDGIAAVQAWVNDANTNFGFVIQKFVTSSDGIDLSSREAATASQRPKITITYAAPSASAATRSAITGASLTAAATDKALTSLATENYGLALGGSPKHANDRLTRTADAHHQQSPLSMASLAAKARRPARPPGTNIKAGGVWA